MDHGMITTDCPTVAEVESVDIWSVKDLTDTEYEVTYCVKQRISEGEQTTDQSNVYQVTVHRDEKGKMLVVKTRQHMRCRENLLMNRKKRKQTGALI